MKTLSKTDSRPYLVKQEPWQFRHPKRPKHFTVLGRKAHKLGKMSKLNFAQHTNQKYYMARVSVKKLWNANFTRKDCDFDVYKLDCVEEVLEQLNLKPRTTKLPKLCTIAEIRSSKQTTPDFNTMYYERNECTFSDEITADTICTSKYFILPKPSGFDRFAANVGVEKTTESRNHFMKILCDRYSKL